MTPEISHRCPACGASIRDFGERALFCPECGKPLATAESHEASLLAEGSPENEIQAQPAESHEASIVTEEPRETNQIQSAPVVSRGDGIAAASAAASEVGDVQPTGDEPPGDKNPKLGADEVTRPRIGSSKASRHGARERTRATLHRASNVARGAIEDNVKRVEKIHHASSVVLEEAHYDPSLRFVLVALGLFVVFVLLLVLSKVMG